MPTLPPSQPTERQTTPPPVNYQVVEKDGGTVWVKPPTEVTTYYPSLMKGAKPRFGMADADTSIRLAAADRQ